MNNGIVRAVLILLVFCLSGAATGVSAQGPPRPRRDDAPRDKKQPPGPIVKEDKRGDRQRGDERPRGDERRSKERRPPGDE